MDADEQKRRAVRALARGEAHAAEHNAPFGWHICTRRAPIVKNSEYIVSEYSQGAWRRELSLTLIAGQHLPRLLAGMNSLELTHAPSGVIISFSALEALREWTLLNLPPVPHLAATAAQPEWEYTFTTTYPGTTTRAPHGVSIPVQPDQRSLYSRPAVSARIQTSAAARPC